MAGCVMGYLFCCWEKQMNSWQWFQQSIFVALGSVRGVPASFPNQSASAVPLSALAWWFFKKSAQQALTV